MLVIRPEQLEVLHEALRATLRRYVLQRAQVEAPRACAAASSEELAACIETAIERAADHDIFGDENVTRFAVLSVQLHFAGPTEDVAHEVAEALDDERLTVPQKLERAEAALRRGAR